MFSSDLLHHNPEVIPSLYFDDLAIHIKAWIDPMLDINYS